MDDDDGDRTVTSADGSELRWEVRAGDITVGHDFEDREDAEGFAAVWNLAYPPAEGHTEFVVVEADAAGGGRAWCRPCQMSVAQVNWHNECCHSAHVPGKPRRWPPFAHGPGWFRIFGVGIRHVDHRFMRPLFSERNRIVPGPYVHVGPHCFALVRRNNPRWTARARLVIREVREQVAREIEADRACHQELTICPGCQAARIARGAVSP